MTNNDRKQFATELTDVLAVYGREASKGVLRVYWEALKHYDLSAVTEALSRHTQNPDNGQFAPKPADLIKLMGGTSNDRALIAWAKVSRAIGAVGGHSSIVFDDALIHAVIHDMGGWPAICRYPESELKFVAREFENRYRTYLFHRPQNYPPKLVGIAEMGNVQAGFPIDPPLTVGKTDACRLVFKGGFEKCSAPTALANTCKLITGGSHAA
ncbi:DUF6475 domain-containing protein [Salinivibrio proteolyticus]|uniref:DUF6475 domain-containing protein n=1 Tax=Salinivibrio proteolyticus TaxID=334715 RepID=A0ABY7LBJ7_9GAMM|nr:DUF6475 domain-containing protein [Salinivibrio proteolyticus]WBA13874.1 DUF6475 domain-containing protein [Salinivibrio proteolyticus]